jgi:hypothetical protein
MERCEARSLVKDLALNPANMVLGKQMKVGNPFEKSLEEWKHRIPANVRDVAIYVTDTMDLCWAAAQAVFEDKATPEIALAIYDRMTNHAQSLKSPDGRGNR